MSDRKIAEIHQVITTALRTLEDITVYDKYRIVKGNLVASLTKLANNCTVDKFLETSEATNITTPHAGFSFRQLGYSDDWLKEKILVASTDTVEVDYMDIWARPSIVSDETNSVSFGKTTFAPDLSLNELKTLVDLLDDVGELNLLTKELESIIDTEKEFIVRLDQLMEANSFEEICGKPCTGKKAKENYTYSKPLSHAEIDNCNTQISGESKEETFLFKDCDMGELTREETIQVNPKVKNSTLAVFKDLLVKVRGVDIISEDITGDIIHALAKTPEASMEITPFIMKVSLRLSSSNPLGVPTNLFTWRVHKLLESISIEDANNLMRLSLTKLDGIPMDSLNHDEVTLTEDELLSLSPIGRDEYVCTLANLEQAMEEIKARTLKPNPSELKLYDELTDWNVAIFDKGLMDKLSNLLNKFYRIEVSVINPWFKMLINLPEQYRLIEPSLTFNRFKYELSMNRFQYECGYMWVLTIILQNISIDQLYVELNHLLSFSPCWGNTNKYGDVDQEEQSSTQPNSKDTLISQAYSTLEKLNGEAWREVSVGKKLTRARVKARAVEFINDEILNDIFDEVVWHPSIFDKAKIATLNNIIDALKDVAVPDLGGLINRIVHMDSSIRVVNIKNDIHAFKARLDTLEVIDSLFMWRLTLILRHMSMDELINQLASYIPLKILPPSFTLNLAELGTVDNSAKKYETNNVIISSYLKHGKHATLLLDLIRLLKQQPIETIHYVNQEADGEMLLKILETPSKLDKLTVSYEFLAKSNLIKHVTGLKMLINATR